MLTCKKHNVDFELLDGCPQCVAERLAEEVKVNSSESIAERIKEAKARVEGMLSIVKVKYYSEAAGGLSPREYTYFSVDRLNVGDIVTVPVRDTTGKAMVSAIDVPETQIEAFRDKVKTIPTGSKVKEEAVGVPNRSVPNETEAVIRVDSGACLAPTALALRPGEDAQVQSWYNEALGLQKYAEARVIKTAEDLKPANDDLVTIRRLKKALEEKRKEYVKPLQDHVKSINDTFKTFMEPIEIADKVTSQKMLAFDAEQKRIRSEQERINAERIKLAQDEMKLNGELTESVNLVEVIQEVPTTIRTEVGTTGQRDNWKWEVQDINQVPREYLMINAGMLTPIVKASKGRLAIPGIRIYNEPIIAYRS